MRLLCQLRSWLVVIAAGFIVLGLAPASAASPTISRSYHASGNIPAGSIVSLDAQSASSVQPTNTTNAARMIGIAIAANDSLLAINSTAGTVQVATSGTAQALVSTVNGDISQGDMIAASPFGGMGMKALPGTRVIGVAQAAFNSSSPGAQSQQVRSTNGVNNQVWAGAVPVSIGVGTDTTTPGGTQLNSLQKIVLSLTGRVISTARIIISLVVAGVALVSLATLVYSAIYGSIISIGRNPLAKFIVLQTLRSVLAIAALIALLAGVVIFLLLH